VHCSWSLLLLLELRTSQSIHGLSFRCDLVHKSVLTRWVERYDCLGSLFAFCLCNLLPLNIISNVFIDTVFFSCQRMKTSDYIRPDGQIGFESTRIKVLSLATYRFTTAQAWIKRVVPLKSYSRSYGMCTRCRCRKWHDKNLKHDMELHLKLWDAGRLMKRVFKASRSPIEGNLRAVELSASLQASSRFSDGPYESFEWNTNNLNSYPELCSNNE